MMDFLCPASLLNPRFSESLASSYPMALTRSLRHGKLGCLTQAALERSSVSV